MITNCYYLTYNRTVVRKNLEFDSDKAIFPIFYAENDN